MNGHLAVVGCEGFELPDTSNLGCLEIRSERDLPLALKAGFTIKLDAETNTAGSEARLTIFYAPDNARSLRINLGRNSRNNALYLSQAAGLSGVYNFAGRNNTVIDCGNGSGHRSSIISSFHGDDGLFYWGRNSTSNGLTMEFRRAGDAVLFGEDCMLATEIMVRPTDMHAIFSTGNEEVLNNKPLATHPVIIFPHTWIAQRSLVLKNVMVGPGAIIGAGSILSRSVPHTCAVAGVPARIVQENVSWTRASDPPPQEVARVNAGLKKHIEFFEGVAKSPSIRFLPRPQL
ncbi:hypothetical protein [Roseomonas haemaphysalidis]|uniref:Acyltransferase n=1 Tax=Roseomonas haemaphysalidis TaxID=2768162 RepID=A0ABS3KMB8_9PROT|nr:hypothetical protein [Roseomonas haemaphysalidis]MBO1078110.1 hypothetical protein [Roseomonas haemaphysalidis]